MPPNQPERAAVSVLVTMPDKTHTRLSLATLGTRSIFKRNGEAVFICGTELVAPMTEGCTPMTPSEEAHAHACRGRQREIDRETQGRFTWFVSYRVAKLNRAVGNRLEKCYRLVGYDSPGHDSCHLRAWQKRKFATCLESLAMNLAAAHQKVRNFWRFKVDVWRSTNNEKCT